MTGTDTGTPSSRFTGDGVTQSRAVAVGRATRQTGDYEGTGMVTAETTHLYKPAIEANCVSATTGTVRKTHPDDGEVQLVVIKTVVRGHDFDFQIATRAPYRLAELNEVNSLYLADLGFCLGVSC